VSTLGRLSEDAATEEVRGLLQKQSSRGKRRQGDTARPSTDVPRPDLPPIPSSAYAQPPSQRGQPMSPSSISTGNIEEIQYQQMMPPPRSTSQGPAAQQPQQPGGGNPNNPYRSPSQQSQQGPYPYKP
jgi:hypothetical protein